MAAMSALYQAQPARAIDMIAPPAVPTTMSTLTTPT